MNREKFTPVLKGLLSLILPLQKFRQPPPTGGSIKSRYCYAIWMRHITAANKNGYSGIPHTLAELGPGDSIGLGLAALLSGCELYYALDVYRYWDAQRNLRIFDELVELFRSKAPIPSTTEFPRVIPVIEDCGFPHHIFTEEQLARSLAPERIAAIRNEILLLENKSSNTFIQYYIPWYDKSIAEASTVDFIISQAALQYVDDLDQAYAAMNTWLKKGGIMSHSIDFTSHGTTKKWNGHWTYSTWEWKLIRGKKKVGLNRAPQSVHLTLNQKYHFSILQQTTYQKENMLQPGELSKQFNNLSNRDLTASTMFIQSVKQ